LNPATLSDSPTHLEAHSTQLVLCGRPSVVLQITSWSGIVVWLQF